MEQQEISAAEVGRDGHAAHDVPQKLPVGLCQIRIDLRQLAHRCHKASTESMGPKVTHPPASAMR